MIDEFKADIEERIISSGRLGAAERHLLMSRTAKHVRPVFLYACGSVLDVPKEKLLDFACSVELLHTATLIHDDIIDEATQRRSLESVNQRYGNKIAVLAGDSLLANALSILTAGPRPIDAVKRTSNTVIVMAEAVTLELELQNEAQPTEEQLFQVIDGKTGALFALCGYLAGIAADDDTAAHKMERIGTLIGRIFQLKDDIDDLDEDQANHTPTVPTVFGIEVTTDHIDKAQSELDALCKEFEPYPQFQQLRKVIDKITRKTLSSLPVNDN